MVARSGGCSAQRREAHFDLVDCDAGSGAEEGACPTAKDLIYPDSDRGCTSRKTVCSRVRRISASTALL